MQTNGDRFVAMACVSLHEVARNLGECCKIHVGTRDCNVPGGNLSSWSRIARWRNMTEHVSKIQMENVSPRNAKC